MVSLDGGALVVTLPGRVLTCGLLSPDLAQLGPFVTPGEMALVLRGIAVDDIPAMPLLRTGLTDCQVNGRMVRP